MSSKSSDDARMVKQAMFVAITIMVLVMLMDIVQFSLDDDLRLAEQEELPAPSQPTLFWEQCQIWNKWAESPRRGSCPGDFQARVWR